jgi:Zn-dependent protease with chaperone function
MTSPGQPAAQSANRSTTGRTGLCVLLRYGEPVGSVPVEDCLRVVSSDVRANSTVCPACGAGLEVETGWPVWCPACEWGLTARQSEPAGRWASWRAGRMHARVLANHERLRSSDLRADGGSGWIAAALAVAVHLTTLMSAAMSLLVWTTGALLGVKIFASLLLAGIAWEVRPRLWRPVLDDALTPATAPTAFALVGEVAAATGSRPPDRILVSDEFNAAYGRAGVFGQRVLVLGLPLWNALDDQQRLALLGHECAHDVNRDLRSGLLVGTAIGTLRRWAWLLYPDRRRSQRPWAVAGSPSSGLVMLAEFLVPVILLPLSATVGLLAVGLHRLAARSGQRAEYRADELAATVAGTDASVQLLEQFLAGDASVMSMQTALRANPNADIWARQRAFLDSIPDSQRERWRRIAGREQHRTDASHPPTLLRQDMLNSREHRSPLLTAHPETFQLVTNELFSRSAVITREIHDACW